MFIFYILFQKTYFLLSSLLSASAVDLVWTPNAF